MIKSTKQSHFVTMKSFKHTNKCIEMTVSMNGTECSLFDFIQNHRPKLLLILLINLVPGKAPVPLAAALSIACLMQ